MSRYPTLLLILLFSSLTACSQNEPAGQSPADASPPDVSGLNLCTEPRPEICTMNYAPVCGVHEDGSRSTYSNACSACSNAEVVGSLPGACPE